MKKYVKFFIESVFVTKAKTESHKYSSHSKKNCKIRRKLKFFDYKHKWYNIT